MQLYRSLHNLGLKKSYSFKFFFVAFIGIHIPLLAFIIFVLFSENLMVSKIEAFTIILIFTLLATATTLIIIRKLLNPVNLASRALAEFKESRKVPDLPMEYTDQAGLLLFHLQETLNSTDNLLKDKDDLVSLFSHDLRSPISSIVGMAELISIEESHEMAKEYAKTVTKQGKQLLQDMEDLLLLLKSNALRLRNEQEKEAQIDLCIKKIIAQNKNKLKAKKLNLINHIEPVKAMISPVVFEHAFQNLLSNAIKFSYEGNEIIVSAKKEDQNLIVEVQDYGIGFEPEKAELIFNRFTNEGSQGTAGERSSGLGLYISRKLLIQNRSNISAFSQGKGKGSCFSIKMKLSE